MARCRRRGSVAGRTATAERSAESPLVAGRLGAEIEIATPAGRTGLPADEFFIGPMITSVMPGDCVCAVRFPVWPHARVGTGFHEVSARQSDFAFVAAAAQVAIDDDGRCLDATLGLGGVGDRAVRIDVTRLIGQDSSLLSISDVVQAATADLETSSDLHATAEYRRRVAAVLGARALEDAFAEARHRTGAVQ